MGFKDLGRLFKGRNIVFGILVLWLLTAYTILYFALSLREIRIVWLAQLIFFPLLVVCLVLFIYAAFFRGDVRKLSWKNIGKASLFFLAAIGIYLLVGYVVFFIMIDLFTSLMFVISIFSYIFITALFSLHYCFVQGVKFDDTVYKAPTFIAFITRWGLFIFGILISIFLLLYAPNIIAGIAPVDPTKIKTAELALMLYWMPIITIGMILAVTLVAIAIVIIRGRFNAWLGVFFVFIGGYITFLMISALFTIKTGRTLPILIARIVMFAFDMFILLITIGGLAGKKAELIGKKLKILSSDAVLIWLIFAKAAFEYSDYILIATPGELTVMKSVAIFFLVIPLMIVMSIYGIAKYGSMKKKRKRVKLRKERVKTSKKQIEKITKVREKAEKKAEKKAAKERKKSLNQN